MHFISLNGKVYRDEAEWSVLGRTSNRNIRNIHNVNLRPRCRYSEKKYKTVIHEVSYCKVNRARELSIFVGVSYILNHGQNMNPHLLIIKPIELLVTASQQNKNAAHSSEGMVEIFDRIYCLLFYYFCSLQFSHKINKNTMVTNCKLK